MENRLILVTRSLQSETAYAAQRRLRKIAAGDSSVRKDMNQIKCLVLRPGTLRIEPEYSRNKIGADWASSALG